MVVAGFIKAEGSPFGFSNLATHSLLLVDSWSLLSASDSPPLNRGGSTYKVIILVR